MFFVKKFYSCKIGTNSVRKTQLGDDLEKENCRYNKISYCTKGNFVIHSGLL